MKDQPKANWYRVVGFGHGGGSPRRTAEAAWNSARRMFPEDQWGTAIAANSFRLYAATTQRAAFHADISVVRGGVGRGKFWLVS